MFEGPEYASYIALCRELRLEREVDVFDAVFDPRRGTVMEAGWWTERQTHKDRKEELVWLPRLDQWLAMLEEEGETEVKFSLATKVTREWIAYIGTAAPIGIAPTREEAAARLWMAVR